MKCIVSSLEKLMDLVIIASFVLKDFLAVVCEFFFFFTSLFDDRLGREWLEMEMKFFKEVWTTILVVEGKEPWID